MSAPANTVRATLPAPGATPTHPSESSVIAGEVKALVESGDRDAARDRFGVLVALWQRRAVRLAFHYLRDAADADDVVQDAFVKVFVHIDQYRTDRPFDLWFTRILVNTALDRLKARARMYRWASPVADGDDSRPGDEVPDPRASPERQLLASEDWRRAALAVEGLPERQRLVFTLSCIDERSAAEISAVTGMQPATVRVHLFRALRKLRAALGGPR